MYLVKKNPDSCNDFHKKWFHGQEHVCSGKIGLFRAMEALKNNIGVIGWGMGALIFLSLIFSSDSFILCPTYIFQLFKGASYLINHFLHNWAF